MSDVEVTESPDSGSSEVRPRRRLESERAATRAHRVAQSAGDGEAVFDIRDLSVFYGDNPALAGTTMKIYRNLVTAVIGPSGCGKSTFIRMLNRMHEVIPAARWLVSSSSTGSTSTTAR